MNPDIQLEQGERAQLVAIKSQPGFVVLNRIMRAEVDKFVLRLINADASDDAEVLAAHKMAKASAQFYQAVIDHVNEETLAYTKAPRSSDKPTDPTSGLIDLGDELDSVPNLLGGDFFGGEEL